MTYEKIVFENLPSEKTPISAENLNHMQDGIKDSSDFIATATETGINLFRSSSKLSAKQAIEVDKFVQSPSQTTIYSQDSKVWFFLNNSSWGAYSSITSSYVALGVNCGGTGATTASNARLNLDVYSKTEVDGKIPVAATSANMGLVRVAASVPSASNYTGISILDLLTNLNNLGNLHNQLLTSLKNAGILSN